MKELGKGGDFQAYNEYSENPFKPCGVEERWVDKKNSEQPVEFINKETGEVVIMMTPKRRVKVNHDPAKFAKVFRECDVSKLTPSGKSLLLFLAYRIKINKDVIHLHWHKVSEWCRFSKNTFYSAVKELLDADILAIKLKKDNSYYVNPNYVFNGNRTKI